MQKSSQSHTVKPVLNGHIWEMAKCRLIQVGPFKTGSKIPLFDVCKIKLRKLVIGRVLMSIYTSSNHGSRSVFETIVMGLSRGPVTISTVIVILNTEPQVP